MEFLLSLGWPWFINVAVFSAIDTCHYTKHIFQFLLVLCKITAYLFYFCVSSLCHFHLIRLVKGVWQIKVFELSYFYFSKVPLTFLASNNINVLMPLLPKST